MNKKTSRMATWLAALLLLALSANGVSAASAAGFSQADIFDPTKINSINFTIPAASVTALNTVATAKTYTAASVTITAAGYTMGPIQIGLRLKGSTSLELLNKTPSFKLAFNWGASKGQRLVGLKNLTLNAMTQDGSHLHEFAAYKLSNAMNVPAPRTGWADVKVNGVERGLYVSIETYDDVMLANHFTDTTQHLYEGMALQDLKPGNNDGAKDTGHYLVHEGWGAYPNKNDLGQLIWAANQTNLAAWWKQLATVTDRAELIRFFALENFVGQWDGYSGPIINNYMIRSNLDGKFAFMPWGMDQSFGENRQTVQPYDDYFFPMDKPQVGFPWVQQSFHKTVMDRGLLFRKCLAYAPCKTEYLLDLKATSAKATAIKLVTAMKAAATLQEPYLDSSIFGEQTRTEAWVGKQQTRVAALLKLNKIK